MTVKRSLIVGLRNPGAAYEGTRHNVGAEAVAAVASRHAGSFGRLKRRIRSDVADVRLEGHPAVLALPKTFMNESGSAIAPIVDYYDVDLCDLLIVHDDIDLPFAKLRVQLGRSAGGNNGVKSTIRSLGSPEFWRLKLGVGRPPGATDPAVFVLKPFSRRERPDVDVMIEQAADVIEAFISEGGDAARQLAGDLNAAS